MKTFSAPWANELAAGRGNDIGAVKIATATPFLVWGGVGNLNLTDHGVTETYVGIGGKGLVAATASQLGGGEQSLELRLSGIEPEVLAMVQASDVRNAAVVVWRLGFDAAGVTLLDSQVYARGRVNQLARVETAKGEAAISCTVITAASGSGRATGRMRADADQRLISGTDGGMRRVTMAGDITLALGGKPPQRAANALPGVSGYGGLVGGVLDKLIQTI
jgi:hypothetical protein